MNITQFLARLSYGPLSNLAMSNDGDGTINVAKHPSIVSYLNDGLLKLYAKLNLREAELVIEQMETVTSYRLKSLHALTTAVANPLLDHYIIDSASRPFTDDLIKVIRVVSDGGLDLPLNDDNHPNSVYTPSSHLLQVPDPEHGKPLYVIYQAKHPVLTHTTLTAEIDVPDVLEPALVSWVAYNIYVNMNGQEHAAIAAAHLAAFENTLAEVADQDLVSTTQSHTNTKFHERGFR
jgi:hypothetical protein